MNSKPISYFYITLLAAFFLNGCSESPKVVDAQPKQSITLRAASAVAENKIEFFSYDGAMVDVIVNSGDVQTFPNQGNAVWDVEVDGVILGQENTVEVEWYIVANSSETSNSQDPERYIVARQSGSFMAGPEIATANFEAEYETEAFDHDNDTVSNLIEVNAGGFPVPDTAIPEVVDIVSPGIFTIGSLLDEPGSLAYENEMAAQTAIANNYSIGKFEVTYSQFQTHVEAIETLELPDDNNWGGGDLPVTNVTWSEAYAYTAWLSKITGDTYRLPTEAEWEFAARGNTTTRYFTGPTLTSHDANFNTPVLEAVYFQNVTPTEPNEILGVFRHDGEGLWAEFSFDDVTREQESNFTFEEVRRDAEGIWIFDDDAVRGEAGFLALISKDTGEIIRVNPLDNNDRGLIYKIADRSPSIAEFIGKRPIAIGSFSPNDFGLYDMHGNVWEWTCSVRQIPYLGSEQNCVEPEFADTTGNIMIKRGGSWNLPARENRSTNRGWNNQFGQRLVNTGFRVVKEP